MTMIKSDYTNSLTLINPLLIQGYMHASHAPQAKVRKLLYKSVVF